MWLQTTADMMEGKRVDRRKLLNKVKEQGDGEWMERQEGGDES